MATAQASGPRPRPQAQASSPGGSPSARGRSAGRQRLPKQRDKGREEPWVRAEPRKCRGAPPGGGLAAGRRPSPRRGPGPAVPAVCLFWQAEGTGFGEVPAVLRGLVPGPRPAADALRIPLASSPPGAGKGEAAVSVCFSRAGPCGARPQEGERCGGEHRRLGTAGCVGKGPGGAQRQGLCWGLHKHHAECAHGHLLGLHSSSMLVACG